VQSGIAFARRGEFLQATSADTFTLLSDTRKGQPLPGTFPCSQLKELTPIPVKNRLSGICRVRLRFPGDLTLDVTLPKRCSAVLGTWPTPGPANSCEPAIILLKSLNTSHFWPGFRLFVCPVFCHRTGRYLTVTYCY